MGHPTHSNHAAFRGHLNCGQKNMQKDRHGYPIHSLDVTAVKAYSCEIWPFSRSIQISSDIPWFHVCENLRCTRFFPVSKAKNQKWLKDVVGTIYRENNLEKLQKWVNSWVFCNFFCPKHPKTKPMIHNSVSRLQNINTWSTAQLSSSPCQGLPPKVWVAYGTAQWWAACSRHRIGSHWIPQKK
jgi:hypothetical protein